MKPRRKAAMTAAFLRESIASRNGLGAFVRGCLSAIDRRSAFSLPAAVAAWAAKPEVSTIYRRARAFGKTVFDKFGLSLPVLLEMNML